MPAARLPLAPGVLVMILTACLAAAPLFADWNLETVEAPRAFWTSSVALTPAGIPAIAYGGATLNYAVWDGSGWDIQTVDGTECAGRFPSLGFDPAGHPAISYYDGMQQSINVARWDGTQWNLEQLAPARLDGSDLAFDHSGRPAVAFYTTTSLTLARWDGSVWQLQEVTPSAGMEQSLAFDAADNPAIAYVGGGFNLELARWSGTVWTTETVAVGDTWGGSLVFDPATNHALISFTDASGLELARHDGQDWQIEDVDNTDAWLTSLALDGSGNPVIGYTVGPLEEVWLARWTGLVWQVQLVESVSGLDATISLALDPAGGPALAYSGSPMDLKLARWAGTSWAIDIVDTGTINGFATSLAYDSAGQPVIAYFDHAHQSLKLAQRNGASWDIQTVDDSGEVGEYLSMALDSNDYPAIAYYHYPPLSAVEFARWDGSVWGLETVDSGGRNPSLAFVDDKPAIAYDGVEYAILEPWGWDSVFVDDGAKSSLAFDADGRPAVTDNDVDLLRWNGATWDKWPVDAGYLSALAFDGAGDPNVGYARDDSVRFAFWTGVAFQSEQVDTLLPDPLRSISLALDSASGHVLGYSYFNFMANKPTTHAAFRNGSDWYPEVVVTGPAASPYHSLALDGSGQPAVSFVSWCSGYLKLATMQGQATLHRGVVSDLSPGWKEAALPLDSSNDDETAPFPLATVIPGSEQDTAVPVAPLVLYRVLWPEDRPARNTLRLTKEPTSVALSF